MAAAAHSKARGSALPPLCLVGYYGLIQIRPRSTQKPHACPVTPILRTGEKGARRCAFYARAPAQAAAALPRQREGGERKDAEARRKGNSVMLNRKRVRRAVRDTMDPSREREKTTHTRPRKAKCCRSPSCPAMPCRRPRACPKVESRLPQNHARMPPSVPKPNNKPQNASAKAKGKVQRVQCARAMHAWCRCV